MLVVAGVVGFAIIGPGLSAAKGTVNGFNVYGFAVLGLLGAAIINVVGFEIAHVIGAKIGGYDVISVNVVGFYFYKKLIEVKDKDGNVHFEKKTKFKFPTNYDGLTGETVIMPKSEKSNPMPYVFAPVLFFAIEVILLIFAYIFITDPSKSSTTTQNPLLWMRFLQLFIVTIGGMVTLYDYFPTKLDSTTDGYRITLLSKKVNVQAFNVYLTILGNDVLNKKEVNYKVFDEITDFTTKVNLLIADTYLRKDEYNDALEIINKITISEAKLSTGTLCLAKVHLLYIYLYYGMNDKAKELYLSFLPKEKEYFKGEYDIYCFKTYILYSALIDNSESEVKITLKKKNKVFNRIAPSRLEYEEVGLDKVLEKIKKERPEIKI